MLFRSNSMKKYWGMILVLISTVIVFSRCGKEDEPDFPYNLSIPAKFPKPIIPADNPLTVAGVKLGRKLFYDKRLSINNQLSCAGCHKPHLAFADDARYSTGAEGAIGTINAPSLINMTWYSRFFWDGRAKSLEEQVLEPIQNPIEMHETLAGVVAKVQADVQYGTLFKKAFGSSTVTAERIAKAIAQFERTMISGGTSTYDRFLQSGNPKVFTEEEYEGYLLFFSETGDCFHCHGGALTTSTKFENNGLESTIDSTGIGPVIHNSDSDGMFQVPTLRNAVFTAPYMHDGRFNTLEEVIEHYNSGLQDSRTLHPKLKIKVDEGGLQLTEEQKKQLLAFLKTMTDTAFLTRSDLQQP